MKTMNEMIFATLKTKADKPAKYADQLREAGYEVENHHFDADGNMLWERDYWAVNDLEVYKYDGQVAQLWLGRGNYVEKFENIKKIDFVDFFEKDAEREEKFKRMTAHNSIEQRHEYWTGIKRIRVQDGPKPWNWHYRKERQRHHRIADINHVIDEYKALKRKADAVGCWYRAEADAEIEYAKKAVADAEARVEKLRKQLEKALADVEHRKKNVQKEIDKKAEGQRELDEWLKARGVRAA